MSVSQVVKQVFELPDVVTLLNARRVCQINMKILFFLAVILLVLGLGLAYGEKQKSIL